MTYALRQLVSSPSYMLHHTGGVHSLLHSFSMPTLHGQFVSARRRADGEAGGGGGAAGRQAAAPAESQSHTREHVLTSVVGASAATYDAPPPLTARTA